MNGFYAQVTALLKDGGFYFVRQGKGSHEIWSNGRLVVSVPSNCKSRHTANSILKDAQIGRRL
jgi:predicted RNA binding protein YcfA (HicA-like mRNA interferase family)